MRALVCPTSAKFNVAVNPFSDLMKQNRAKLLMKLQKNQQQLTENELPETKIAFRRDSDDNHLNNFHNAIKSETESAIKFDKRGYLSNADSESPPSSVSLATDEMPTARTHELESNEPETNLNSQMYSMEQDPFCDEDKPSVKATIVFPTDSTPILNSNENESNHILQQRDHDQ